MNLPDKAWFLQSAEIEGEAEVGAGMPPSAGSPFKACERCSSRLACAACQLCHLQLEEESWRARQAYIAAGVCADCGACSAKEAEEKCKPYRDITDEWICAGEALWQERRESNASAEAHE